MQTFCYKYHQDTDVLQYVQDNVPSDDCVTQSVITHITEMDDRWYVHADVPSDYRVTQSVITHITVRWTLAGMYMLMFLQTIVLLNP
jgi:hypothetical protein